MITITFANEKKTKGYFMNNVLHYVFLSLIIIVLNIPFGYWREGTRKFSLNWILAIHIPVPLVVLLRHLFDVKLLWSTAPLLFGSFFIGQFLGKKIRVRRKLHTEVIN